MYSLKDILGIQEGFTNPPSKSKNKSKPKSKKKSKKEKFEDKKKPNTEVVWWKIGLMWILLPLFFYIGIRIIIFFWSRFFTLIGH